MSIVLSLRSASTHTSHLFTAVNKESEGLGNVRKYTPIEQHCSYSLGWSRGSKIRTGRLYCLYCNAYYLRCHWRVLWLLCQGQEHDRGISTWWQEDASITDSHISGIQVGCRSDSVLIGILQFYQQQMPISSDLLRALSDFILTGAN